MRDSDSVCHVGHRSELTGAGAGAGGASYPAISAGAGAGAGAGAASAGGEGMGSTSEGSAGAGSSQPPVRIGPMVPQTSVPHTHMMHRGQQQQQQQMMYQPQPPMVRSHRACFFVHSLTDAVLLCVVVLHRA